MQYPDLTISDTPATSPNNSPGIGNIELAPKNWLDTQIKVEPYPQTNWRDFPLIFS
jgi:hypothetical protein